MVAKEKPIGKLASFGEKVIGLVISTTMAPEDIVKNILFIIGSTHINGIQQN